MTYDSAVAERVIVYDQPVSIARRLLFSFVIHLSRQSVSVGLPHETAAVLTKLNCPWSNAWPALDYPWVAR